MKHWTIFTLLLLLGLTLSLTSMAKKSPTFDETAHIAAGYSYLATGDYRMNIEHPPLVKELSALPLRLLHPRFTPEEEWTSSDPWSQWELGRKFLYEWNAPERLVFWARVPVVLLFALLGVLIYCCAREFYGPRSGLVALGLYMLTPDFLAHGQLVTTDLAIALFMFSCIYFFYRALSAFSWGNATGFALSLGLAAVSKYSASLLVVILLALALLWLADHGNRLRVLPSTGQDTGFSTRLRILGILAGLGLAVTWLLIWTTYGFRFTLTPDATVFDWTTFRDHGILTRLASANQQWRLLPEGYVGGFFSLLELLGGRAPYFFGTYTNDYWWCYYPVTFLLKTPLPLIALIGLGFARRCRGGWPRRDTFFLLLPAGLYLVVAIATKVSVGHRHILPIYPFLLVWVAEVGREFDAWRVEAKKVVPALLIGWQALGTFCIYPDFLTFFNELGGGPKRGMHYLIDSNLDWGQDLGGLAEFRDKHPGEPFFVSYYGTADPRYYLRDVRYLPCYLEVKGVETSGLTVVPPGAYVAISATILMSADLDTDDPNSALAKKLRETVPVERIGNSILIYRFP